MRSTHRPFSTSNSRIAFLAGFGLLIVSMGQSGLECPLIMTPDTQPTTGNSGITGQYVGSTRCAQCHASVHSNWSETLHAGALDTLKAINQGENANCIGCHTVGFGEEGGFVDEATTFDLAGVGCEACHGPAKQHVENVQDASLRPAKNIAASVCGQCHTGEHHPNFDEWETSKHALVNEHVAESLTAGTNANACGQCHSGDFFYMSRIKGETVADDFLKDVERADQNAVTCAVCHNPHQRTGNAPDPGDGRDFQLRFPEIAFPTPTNTIDAAIDPTRFNICGQCHHSRGRTWAVSSRGPHHSVQANVYIGEMPMPDDDAEVTPLAPSLLAKHYEAPEQCATCHMYRKDFESEEAPAIAGHTFAVSFEGCVASGCHTSAESIETRAESYQSEIMDMIDALKARLNANPGTGNWEYTSDGGPDAMGQAALHDGIKKARFLIAYVENDGSLGIHNPPYVEGMLSAASDYLDDAGVP